MAGEVQQAIQRARAELHEMTGLQIGTTTSFGKHENGWKLTVEAVEKKSIPDGMDILASYEVFTAADGSVISFSRTGMRKRIDTAVSAAE